MQLRSYEIRHADTGEVLDRMSAVSADSAKMVYRLRLERWHGGTATFDEKMKEPLIVVEVDD